MTPTTAQNRPAQQGFTLVELAIVMVIIGILIGGILKGQELIANAETSASVSQLKALDAAINTFREKYNSLPGDVPNPGVIIPNCGAAPCSTAGNGNNNIDGTVFAEAPLVGAEGATMFSHLLRSDMISGIDDRAAALAFGAMLPEVRAGGGMWVGFLPTATAAPAGTTLVPTRHYAILNGTVANVGNATGALTANAAAQIDRKLDDGVPAVGSTQVVGTDCAASGVYNEANEAARCALFVRVLN